jgi:hypothetical protein
VYVTGTIPAHTAKSDGIYHNHIYNQLYWGTSNPQWPSLITEETPAGVLHWTKSGYGNLSRSHDATYYTRPWCNNSDSVSHTVTYCEAEW